jgi:hypothetical protein
MLIGPYTGYARIENLCLFKKVTLHICTPVACVLLFRINNIILTTSFRYVVVLGGNASAVVAETHCQF